MLEVGMKAPEFTLQDQDGREVSLADYRGKKVVLYFSPKDNTPGCTRQACAFAALYGQFEALGAVVIGVSKDSAASHQRFAQKNNLPFLLLSDPELQAIWAEKIAAYEADAQAQYEYYGMTEADSRPTDAGEGILDDVRNLRNV